MSYDQKIAELFLMNFKEPYRFATLLRSSYARLQGLFPLSGEKLTNLSTDDLDKVDAFRVRICDLQDTLGAKVFRTLLKLEEEYIGSQLDIINKIEKREIIPSFDTWKELREIRNLFSHDYPEDETRRAEAISIAHKSTPILLNILKSVKQYVEDKVGIPMNEFPMD
ncbi:MAG: hypothetical protein AAGG81_07100 [Chlamydiota bacterium]